MYLSKLRHLHWIALYICSIVCSMESRGPCHAPCASAGTSGLNKRQQSVNEEDMGKPLPVARNPLSDRSCCGGQSIVCSALMEAATPWPHHHLSRDILSRKRSSMHVTRIGTVFPLTMAHSKPWLATKEDFFLHQKNHPESASHFCSLMPERQTPENRFLSLCAFED